MGLSLLYISTAYYMQKGGGWVQIACKIAYILNGRPLIPTLICRVRPEMRFNVRTFDSVNNCILILSSANIQVQAL